MSKCTTDCLQQIFDRYSCSAPIFNTNAPSKSYAKDIALVQAFYGVDPARISATANALKAMLKMTTMPSEWIFVEGQTSKDLCCFSWLQQFGITYVFVKLEPEQDGLFMKTPLWNIGAAEAKASRLCFADADVFFCDSNWLDDIVQKLGNEFQVMQLHSYSYSESNSEVSNLDESLGKKLKLYKEGNDGHYGFTIGMSRSAYDSIGRFNCTCILDDLDYWTKIVGDNCISNSKDWLKHDVDRTGILTEVGLADNIICHCDHGNVSNRKYRALSDIIYGKVKDEGDLITYDPMTQDVLPKWNLDTDVGRISRAAVLEALSIDDPNGKQLYFKHACEEFGEADNIIVYSVVPYAFSSTEEKISNFVRSLHAHLKNNFTLVLFCNDETRFYSNQTICIKSDMQKLDFMQIFRDDVDIPENTNILYVPFQNEVTNDISLCDVNEKDIFYSSQLGLMYFKWSEDNISLFKSAKQIGRNLDEFLYFNCIDVRNLEVCGMLI